MFQKVSHTRPNITTPAKAKQRRGARVAEQSHQTNVPLRHGLGGQKKVCRREVFQAQLLASVRPELLMLSKITGIGLVALLQLLGWAVVLSIGLLFLQQTIFLDVFDPSNWGEAGPQRLNPLSSLVF